MCGVPQDGRQADVGCGTARGAVGEELEPEQLERFRAKEAACKAIAAQMLRQAGFRGSAERAQTTIDAIWSMLVGVVFYFRKAGPERFAGVAEEAKRLLLQAYFAPG